MQYLVEVGFGKINRMVDSLEELEALKKFWGVMYPAAKLHVTEFGRTEADAHIPDQKTHHNKNYLSAAELLEQDAKRNS